MNTRTANPNRPEPEVEPEGQESYIVTEGKKRGATRDVRAEAAYDRYYTVLRVHPGDAMRTLEAWGAMIENEHRAYYTAGGRIWMMDLEPSEGKKKRLPGTGAVKK